MKITLDWLEEKRACKESIQAWQDFEFVELDVFEAIEFLKSNIEKIKEKYNQNSLLWLTWLISRSLTNEENIIKFTVYTARQVLYICDEERCPVDDRLRKALEEAERYINANAANAAAYVAAVAAFVALNYTYYLFAAQNKIIDYGIKLIKEENNDEKTNEV